MPLDLKEELYSGDNVVWVSTSNRPPTLIEKRLREEAIKKLEEYKIDEIKKGITIQMDINPMRLYKLYKFLYRGPWGNHQNKIIRVDDEDEVVYGHGIIQEYIERVKNDFANEIYEDLTNKEKEKSNMFKEFMDDVRNIGGEINFSFESNMYVDDEAEIVIRIPTKCLPMLKVQKPMLKVQKTETKKNTKWIEGLPEVAKVEVYNNRVVKATYIDGTFTKAVCSENDTFDLDVGITICAMKRLFGENGTRHYNNYISYVHAVMEKNDKKKLAEDAQRMIDKDKKRKAELKKAAKKLKQKEEQIDIQKQAIIRAHQEIEAAQREEGLA